MICPSISLLQNDTHTSTVSPGQSRHSSSPPSPLPKSQSHAAPGRNPPLNSRLPYRLCRARKP
uniref:Uncharacterized protein n=1 Tax=Arundo donax TaxID=35708 RepID=A0A0A9G4Y9_ARUDO